MQLLILMVVCFLPYGYGEDLIKLDPEFAIRKLDILCNLNEEICGTECYNPATHKCLKTKRGSVHKVCQVDQSLCGYQCWSSSSSGGKICTPEADGPYELICEPGQLPCGINCYKAGEKECFDKTWLCPKGQLSCRGHCYSPSDPVKCLHTKYSSFLCTSEQELCGSWGCYNPKEKTCSEKEDVLCTKGDQLCGRVCYSPTAGDTCHNGTFGGVACKAGEQFCKDRCYDPTKGEICANDARVCNTGETNCGDNNCYEPSSGARCFEAKPDYHVVCAKGKDYCNYNCYDTTTHACLSYEGDNTLKKVCRIGQEICKGKLNHHTWGYGCYNPATSSCLKNKENKYVLCNKGESLCGTTCYTPANDGLVCREDGALCKPDQEACGSQCFDSATKKCFRDIKSDIQWA